MKRLLVATGVAAAVGAATLPAGASAGPGEDLVGGVKKTVSDTLNSVDGILGGGGGGQPAPAPAPEQSAQPAVGAELDPPITSTDPHAEGQVLGVDVGILPLEGEEVIVGESTGSQDASGDYHGQVIPVSVLGLGIAVVETEEGETATSPLAPINDILDDICAASANNVCLALLEFNSETTDSGSQNSFTAARAAVGGDLVTSETLSSEGNISDDGECQTASSSSHSEDLGVAGGAVSADVLDASSDSTACNDGTQTAEGDSQVVDLGALDALDPLNLLGCDSTAVDDTFGLPLLLEGVCNADDTNGAQADAPYNIRKALGLDVLPALEELLDVDLANVDSTKAETLARAPGVDDECPDPTDVTDPDCPPIDECPDPTDASDPDCPPIDECPDPTDASDPDCPPIDECPDPTDTSDPDCPPPSIESGGPSADEPGDDLPFTGADVGTLGAIGLGVMAIGLALMAAADWRRRTVS